MGGTGAAVLLPGCVGGGSRALPGVDGKQKLCPGKTGAAADAFGVTQGGGGGGAVLWVYLWGRAVGLQLWGGEYGGMKRG